MTYEIVIIGDQNDADYVTSINDITPKQLERFKPLIAAIKNSSNRHNFPASDYVDGSPGELYPEFDVKSDDDYSLLDEFWECYVPSGEQGVHTITSIVYYEKPTKIVLL